MAENGHEQRAHTLRHTLIAMLRQFAIDLVPETIAAAGCINDWTSRQPELTSGTAFPRAVGIADFKVRDAVVNAIAQPYRFYLLQRVQDDFDRMHKADQQLARILLTECHLSPILETRLERRIGQQDNLEV